MTDTYATKMVCEQCNDYGRLWPNDVPRQRTVKDGSIRWLHRQCDYWYDKKAETTS